MRVVPGDTSVSEPNKRGPRRGLLSLALLALLVAFALLPAAHPGSARADAPPAVYGDVYGLEWCHQALCGSANFAGVLVGDAGMWPVIGGWSIHVTHDALPRAAGDTTALTGGTWTLVTWRGHDSGAVSGTLTNNGDGTFAIDATLAPAHDNGSTAEVSAKLDHNVFPPSVSGALMQLQPGDDDSSLFGWPGRLRDLPGVGSVLSLFD